MNHNQIHRLRVRSKYKQKSFCRYTEYELTRQPSSFSIYPLRSVARYIAVSFLNDSFISVSFPVYFHFLCLFLILYWFHIFILLTVHNLIGIRCVLNVDKKRSNWMHFRLSLNIKSKQNWFIFLNHNKRVLSIRCGRFLLFLDSIFLVILRLQFPSYWIRRRGHLGASWHITVHYYFQRCFQRCFL